MTAPAPPPLAVVIPALNAASTLPATLAALAAELPAGSEVVVVDGGSRDTTVAAARQAGARVIVATRGRGTQIAAGVAATRAAWVLLLHADTRLAPDWAGAAAAHIAAHPARAGYFRFVLDSGDSRARRLERAVAWRCRVLALPYGDQGLLIRRDVLASAGGVPAVPLMEDVALVRALGRARLVPLDATALTSAAKWEQQGWTRRSARNLVLLALYFCGVPPRLLARLY